MLEVTVKTLDGKNKKFSVPDEYTIEEFKKKIASGIEIAPERQRLIFQGKILHNEKRLQDFDINGKVIHVVQSQAPPPESSTSESASSSNRQDRRNRSHPNGNVRVLDASTMHEMMQNIFSGNVDGSRNIFRSNDGNQVDVHVNMRVVDTPPVRSEAWGRLQVVKRNLRTVTAVVDRLDDPNITVEDLERVEALTMAEELQREREEDEAANRRREEVSEPREELPENPPLSEVADVLDAMLAAQFRLRPHVERYRDLLRSDMAYENPDEARRVQALTNLVNESLHGLSHALHSLTDLMVNVDSAPPRVARATAQPVQPVAATVIQQTIPVSASINLVAGRQTSTTTPTTQTPVTSSSSEGQTPTPTTATSSTTRNQPFVTYSVGQPTFAVGSMSSPPTGTSGTSSTAGTATSNPSPQLPAFFQNILRGVGIPRGQAGTRQATSRIPQAPPTRSAGTSGTTAPNVSNAPEDANSNLQTGLQRASRLVDRYLPCYSRFFRLAQVRASAEQNEASAQSTTEDDIFSQIIQGVAGSGGLRGGNIRLASRGTNTRGETTNNAGTTTGQSRPNPTGGTSSTANEVRSGSSSSSTAQMLSQITQIMHEQLNSSRQEMTPIAQLLSVVGQDTFESRGENTFVDMFNILLQNLGLVDLVGLVQGQHECLNRVRSHWRVYAQEQILQNEPPTEANMTNAINRILNELSEITHSIDTTEVHIRDEIDFPASLRGLTRHHLEEMLKIILSDAENENPSYGNIVGNAFTAYARRLMTICRHSSADDASFHNLIRQQVTSIFASGVDASMRDMMSTMATMQINQIMANSTVPEEEIRQFVVTKTDTDEYMSCGEEEVQPTASSSNAINDKMDTEQSTTRQPQTLAPMPSPPPPPPPPPPPQSSNEEHINIAYGSEEWHSLVDREWVDVIHRDTIRQECQSHATSNHLSDAYISTMPSKRRKIVEKHKEDMRKRLCNGQSHVRLLTNTLETTIEESTRRPITSIQSLMNDICEDGSLVEAFEEDIKERLNDRLEKDTDFDGSSFPNSEKCFRSKNSN
ncbi:DgyrCDS9748 [Dimorphilus gyrociliatus]|uniref:BCL2-associated athanogene 6 n=1 Tax=Dimorphilus gyrociliatus TaxID=2664684 RepID=A0A7I8VZA4_9ANNE|nr:DgyrCDS9748 [Dimorphilus gyrociliatus]